MTSRKRTIKRFRMSGIVADLPSNVLDEQTFSDGFNVEPFDVGMRRSSGNADAYPGTLFEPEHLSYIKNAGQFHWLYASSGGIGASDGQAHFDITPVAGVTSTYPAKWTDSNLNGLVVFNNAIDVPVYWQNSVGVPMQPLPDWPALTTVQAMRSYNYNLIGMDVRDASGDFTNQLIWSNSADPGLIPDSWTVLPENDAGFNTLSDTVGALVDGQQFRDTFMLFKEHSTYLMNFIGGNFVFNFRKLFSTSGILTANCSAEYLGNVIILTDGDLILSDGQSAQSIIDKKMRSFIFNNIDSSNFQTAFVTAYHAENQIWCCFPQNGSAEPDLALVYDVSDGRFGVRELFPPTAHIARGQVGNVTGVINWDDDNESWDSDVTSFNSSLFNPTEDALLQADRSGLRTFAVNEGVDFDGRAVFGRLERTGLDFGDFESVKFVKSVIPRIVGNPGTQLTIRVGAAANDADNVQWGEQLPYTIGESQKIDTYAQGRFLAYSIESNDKTAPWVLHGFEFEYDTQGRF